MLTKPLNWSVIMCSTTLSHRKLQHFCIHRCRYRQRFRSSHSQPDVHRRLEELSAFLADAEMTENIRRLPLLQGIIEQFAHLLLVFFAAHWWLHCLLILRVSHPMNRTAEFPQNPKGFDPCEASTSSRCQHLQVWFQSLRKCLPSLEYSGLDRTEGCTCY